MSLYQSTLTKSQQIVLFVGALITSFLGGLFLLRGDFAYGSYDTMARFIGFNPYGWIGIEYAIENGANIMHASWGGYGYGQALYDTIQLAQDNGIIFVAAAGNESINNDSIPHYPASYDLISFEWLQAPIQGHYVISCHALFLL